MASGQENEVSKTSGQREVQDQPKARTLRQRPQGARQRPKGAIQPDARSPSPEAFPSNSI
jgi:hypothetical protein